MGRKCLKCHYESPAQAQVCGRCGTPLSPAGDSADPALATTTMGYGSGSLSDGVLFANRYLVIEELGKGGMGSVYRVLDIKVDEEVALKFLNQDVAADTKAIERFRSELRIARKIAHHNVCRVYDFGEEGKSLFITMEYIPGEDLAHMIKRLGQLPVGQGYQIAQQVCEGLAEVHSLGIIHRDLKPKNIMIDKEGRAKIMDFGLARTPHGLHLTLAGHIVGTPSYMSPEQLNGEPVDTRADIFAMGVTMYSMLTGSLPFDAETTTTLALQHRTVRPRSPHLLNPRVPEDLSRIVLKCLEIDKTARYATAQELLADLTKAGRRFETYGFSLGPMGWQGSLRALLARPKARIAAGAAMVAVVGLAGLGIRALVSKPNARVPPPPAPVQAPVRKEGASPVPATVRLTLVTTPGRAAVEVDGKPRGLSGEALEVAPGTHNYRISKSGYQEISGNVAVEAGGGPMTREFKLVPLPPATGTLAVTSEPSEASVFLGDSPTAAGKTPFTQAVRAGTVSVKLRLDGYNDLVQQVEVRAGQSASVQGALIPLDGTVTFASDPPGADVYSGADLLGTTPFTRSLTPGDYKLRIAWPGKGEIEAVLAVRPGESLAPAAYKYEGPAPSVLQYNLKVETDPPGATVTVNGTVVKDLTPCTVVLETNEVHIKLEKDGYQPLEAVRYIRPAPARNIQTFELRKNKVQAVSQAPSGRAGA